MKTPQELQFEGEALQVLNLMENTNECVYLTGKAWAWKSTLINYFIAHTKKKFILLGTTWISAINIWGQTIHSFFWIIPNKKTFLRQETKDIIKHTDIFIIDEVSMMRADLFDKIEIIMRMATESEEFMWWKQVVFVWDLFQLPPVPEQNEELKQYFEQKYKWLFFFDWNSFIRDKFKVIELRKVYRQTDPQFINMLNRVRVWDNSRDLLDYFNSRLISGEQMNPKSVLIGTTNAIVEKKNKEELEKLPWKSMTSIAIVRWVFPEDMFPTDKFIEIKEWARVMFTVNETRTFEYVNWSLGTITRIRLNDKWFIGAVDVVLDDWWEIRVEKKTWNNTEWEDPATWEDIVIWQFTQFPFKLAFAITIHKVQGKSFDNVVIDLGWGAFAEGQTYVALSRCESFEWLQLLKPIKAKDIKVSHQVIKFLKE